MAPNIRLLNSLPLASNSSTMPTTSTFCAFNSAFATASCASSSAFSCCSTMSGGSPTMARRNFSLVTCSR